MTTGPLSFILFFDGPCDEESFKPEKESQHWGRRDAIVRCITMALYESINIYNKSCNNCYFIFNNNNDNNTKPAAIVIDGGPELATSVIPIEKNIIRKLKDSARIASSHTKKMQLLSIQNDNKQSYICSYTPWVEAMLIRNKTSIASNIMKRPISDESNTSTKRYKQTFDKRSLLKILQQEASIEFLRKHALNGSETLILKKKNMSSIEKAFNEWNDDASNQHNTNTDINTSNNDNDNNNNDNNNNLLVDTLRVLLYRIVKKLELGNETKKISLTVMLLHENAKHELGIFGSMAFGSQENNDEILYHTVAILGGVRDMTKEEVECVIEAAESLGLHCVGANLGKVAEFTSKIICAMNAHAKMEKRMSHAARILPQLKKEDAKGLLSPPPPPLSSLKDETATKCQGSSLLLHCILNVNLAITEVSSSIEDRHKMHPIIQALVCCLWRSRLAKTISNTNDDDINNDDNSDVSIHTELTLVFKDDVKITISQRSFLNMMSSQHMSAPSEHQVITTFCSILSSTSQHGFSSGYSCLKSLLPNIKQEDRKRTDLFVIDLVKSQENIPNFADEIYSHNCFCDTNIEYEENDKYRIKYVYLLLDSDIRDDAETDVDYILHEWKYGLKKANKKHEKNKKSRMYLKASLFPNAISHSYSAACIITIMQHWGYHGLLVPHISNSLSKKKK